MAAAVRREEAWRIAEILILRHQLAVLQRRQPCRPKPNWADRALPATLPGVIPRARRQGLRASFVAGDEVYGGLDLRRSIRELGSGYVMASAPATRSPCPHAAASP